MAAVADALRAAGYKPLPRWWVTPEQLSVIARIAKSNSEKVSEVRRKFGSGEPNPPPFAKTDEQNREIQSAIDRMWHVINDKMLTDEDKLDIIYGELHKHKRS